MVLWVTPHITFIGTGGHAEQIMLVLPWIPSTILFKGIAKSQFFFPPGPVIIWRSISANEELNINLGQFVFVKKHFL